MYSLRVIQLKSLCAILWQHYKASQVSKSTSRDSIKKVWMTSKTLKQIKCIMKKLDITIVCPWLCNLCSLFALTKEQNNVSVCLLVFLCALLFYTRSEDMQGWPVTLCLYCSARKQFVLFVCSSPKSLSLATWQQITNKRLIILYYSKNKFFYFKWKYRENYNLLKN